MKELAGVVLKRTSFSQTVDFHPHLLLGWRWKQLTHLAAEDFVGRSCSEAAGTANFPDKKRNSVLHQGILVLSPNHMGQRGPYTFGTSLTSLAGKSTSSLHCPGTSPPA